MYVKFKNGLCNCQPSKIDDYGKYQWENPFTLLNGIPQLPAEIFDLISNNTPIPTPIPTSTPTPTTETPSSITRKELEDIERIASCLSVSQLDNYSTWIKLGMVLKKLGAPLRLWEDLSKTKQKVSDERLRKEMANLQDIEHDKWNFDVFGEGGRFGQV